MSILPEIKFLRVYNFEDKIKEYKQICDELFEKPTPWPTVSDDAKMLDEILIHTKKRDLRPVQRAFAIKLIMIHILTEEFYENFGFSPYNDPV